MSARTALTQDGRPIEGLRSFGPETPARDPFRSLSPDFGRRGIADEAPRIRVGLDHYAIDNHYEASEFVLDVRGQRTIRFRAFFVRYEFHPATGLFAILQIEGDPEYTDAAA